jgi:hypothetical protein
VKILSFRYPMVKVLLFPPLFFKERGKLFSRGESPCEIAKWGS